MRYTIKKTVHIYLKKHFHLHWGGIIGTIESDTLWLFLLMCQNQF